MKIISIAVDELYGNYVFSEFPKQETFYTCNNCEWFTSIENNEVVHRCNILKKEISWPFDYTCNQGMFGIDRVNYRLSKLNEK